MKKWGKIIALLAGVFVLGSLILAGRTAWAYEEVDNHPIDVEMEKKMDENPSTAGIIEALEWAEGEWDKLLNANYKALMQKLDKESQGRLRESQRAWIKFRDLEYQFNGAFWEFFDGTMYRTFFPGFRTDFVKERALQLGYYLEDLID